MTTTIHPLVYLEEEEIDEYELDDTGCYAYARNGVREFVKVRLVHLVEPFIDVEGS